MLVAVMAPSTIHVSSSFARRRRRLRDRGTRTRRSLLVPPLLTLLVVRQELHLWQREMKKREDNGVRHES